MVVLIVFWRIGLCEMDHRRKNRCCSRNVGVVMGSVSSPVRLLSLPPLVAALPALRRLSPSTPHRLQGLGNTCNHSLTPTRMEQWKQQPLEMTRALLARRRRGLSILVVQHHLEFLSIVYQYTRYDVRPRRSSERPSLLARAVIPDP